LLRAKSIFPETAIKAVFQSHSEVVAGEKLKSDVVATAG
jgi:hypothetical protein